MEEPALQRICRACLTQEGEMTSVFVKDDKIGTTIHLAEMIMAYASVQITLGDGLPEQICLSCAEKVSNTYVFKQLCEQSDALLRQRFSKSPLRETDPKSNESIAINSDSVNIVIKPEFDLDDELTSEETIEMLDNDFQDDCEMLRSDDSDSDYNPKRVSFKCDVCKKGFSRQSLLTKHKLVHAVKAHACDICGKSFNRSESLLRHRLVHGDDATKIKSELAEFIEVKKEFDEESGNALLDQNFQCKICLREFPEKEGLMMHMRSHDVSPCSYSRRGDNVPVCHVCSKRFMKKSHLTRHLKIHATVKEHFCTLCTKSFARGEQLMNHMNVHSGIKPHVCSICAKGFNQISNLKDHMRTHNGEKPFLCSTCGKGFNQLGNLRQHTIRHSGIKAHLCSICGNGFASKGELGAHLRKHTGARPFVCSICNHGFTTSSSLTKHKRIHSGEKPYECEVCKMKFSRSGILARHKRTHTGEKPYVCKFCGKAFAQSNDLSSHLRIHTGEKPFICDVCGQAFRQSSALKTHKKTHMDRSQILPMAHAHQLIDSKATITMMQNTLNNVLNNAIQ